MATKAETDDTAINDRLRAEACSVAWDVTYGIRALIRLADADPPSNGRDMGEMLHGLRIVADGLSRRAADLARALDSVPCATERLARLEGTGQ